MYTYKYWNFYLIFFILYLNIPSQKFEIRCSTTFTSSETVLWQSKTWNTNSTFCESLQLDYLPRQTFLNNYLPSFISKSTLTTKVLYNLYKLSLGNEHVQEKTCILQDRYIPCINPVKSSKIIVNSETIGPSPSYNSRDIEYYSPVLSCHRTGLNPRKLGIPVCPK